MSIPATYNRVLFVERPQGEYVPEKSYKLEKDIPSPDPASLKDGEVLLQLLYASLDPSMRLRMDDIGSSYVPPLQIGKPMEGTGIGRILATGKNAGGLSKGDIVSGRTIWSELVIAPHDAFRKLDIPSNAKITDFMGPLGMTGLTAYWGMKDVLEIDNITPGQVLVVSGAGGATGSVACQIGKLKGAKVIAIAGTPDKCKWLKEELGMDIVLNYKDKDFEQQFANSTPDFVNRYFDNVGGEILDLILMRLQLNAKIAVCGAISVYDGKTHTIKNHKQLIFQRASMRGFLVRDYDPRLTEAINDLSKWVGEGKIKSKETIIEGLENAPQGLKSLLSGANIGKMFVEVKKP